MTATAEGLSEGERLQALSLGVKALELNVPEAQQRQLLSYMAVSYTHLTLPTKA